MDKNDMIKKVFSLEHDINVLYPKHPNDLRNWDFIKSMAAERDSYLENLTFLDFQAYYKENSI